MKGKQLELLKGCDSGEPDAILHVVFDVTVVVENTFFFTRITDIAPSLAKLPVSSTE